MANDLTGVATRILAQGLIALRNNSIMPLLVNRSYGPEAARKNSTIDVPIPSAVATRDVTPAATAPGAPNSAPTSVAIEAPRW